MNFENLIMLIVLSVATVLFGVAGAMRPESVAEYRSVEVQFHLRSASYTEEHMELMFIERTRPGQEMFRKHLSLEQLRAAVRAPQKTIDAVVSFTKRHGATNIHVFNTEDVVSCWLDIRSDFRAFGLIDSDFVSVSDGSGFRRELHIDPTTLGVKKPEMYSILAIAHGRDEVAARLLLNEDNGLDEGTMSTNHTPNDVRGRYNIPMTPAKAPANFTSGTGQFLNQSFFMSSIETFSNYFSLPQPDVHVSGANPQSSGGHSEGTMDVEIITSLSGGVSTWWIGQNANVPPDNGPVGLDFSRWVEQLLSIPNPPSAVSISYGTGYNVYNSSHLMPMLDADNRAFRKVALINISIFASSGDTGPTSFTYKGCDKYMPMWPASSPYVTAVGATSTTTTHGNETAAFFSGGGFSTVYPAPSYQKQAVRKYLSKPNIPSTSLFDKTGRAYPDVSALGTQFLIYVPVKGKAAWYPGYGTSVSGPIWAAVITRLNLERQRQGLPNVGFLNPALYKLGRVGLDITSGVQYNNHCRTYSFPAAEGWDPVTGLGTPDFEFLLKNL